MTATATTKRRLPLLDAARGLAVVAMVVFHLIWDLAHFGYIAHAIPWSAPVKLFGHGIAFSFLFIAGFSLALAHRDHIRWPAFWRRFAIIAGAAAMVSVGTYVVFPNAWVFFGILHVIAAASLVAIPFLHAPWIVSAVAGAAALAAPWVIAAPLFDADWLIWLGLGAHEPMTQDWRPFFPWTGALLLGVAAARITFSHGESVTQGRGDRLQSASQPLTPALRADALPMGEGLSFLGRHSLIIYLAHQPALFALFTALAFVAPAPLDKSEFVATCEKQCLVEGGLKKACHDLCACTAEKAASDRALDNSTDDAARGRRLNDLASECVAKQK